MKTLIPLILLATLSSGLYFLPASSSEEAAVKKAEQTWCEAIASKSLDQTVASYSPDAVTAGSAMFPARGLRSFGPHGRSFLRIPRSCLRGQRSAS